MKFDWTISLGSILTIVTLLLALVGAYVRFAGRLERLEIKMDLVFDWWRKGWGGEIPPLPPRRRRVGEN